MSKALLEANLWGKAVTFLFFALALILPFIIQKAHLDVTRGGWRPELANFTSHFVLPSIVLPFVILAFMPFSRKAKLVSGILLVPIFIIAFGLFSMVYACDN